MLCIISIELVEYLGRKFLLVVSALGMGVCLTMLMFRSAIITKLCSAEFTTEWHLTSTLVFCFVSSYSIGWGTVVKLVYTEIVHFNVSFYRTQVYPQVKGHSSGCTREGGGIYGCLDIPLMS